ncbi:hypothetical protein PpBr36_04748 [Pyricularia pennisetigena]|uniref:hypothetical protein n=1 Tax=Pyricularia pennisetigena TaxID=1578925 RepID=UPI001153027D|nr:hypothetical protein PpBr36_04748 [Pyricularia pennisetigena]TLS26453.1 hypothetical protein PpBr36_04748 [Pyricularia pennisetigena]
MQLSSLVGLLALATSIAAQAATTKPCEDKQRLYSACIASSGGTGGCHAARLNREQSRDCIKNCDTNAGYTLCLKESQCETKRDSCMSQCDTHRDQCIANAQAKFGPPETN